MKIWVESDFMSKTYLIFNITVLKGEEALVWRKEGELETKTIIDGDLVEGIERRDKYGNIKWLPRWPGWKTIIKQRGVL